MAGLKKRQAAPEQEERSIEEETKPWPIGIAMEWPSPNNPTTGPENGVAMGNPAMPQCAPNPCEFLRVFFMVWWVDPKCCRPSPIASGIIHIAMENGWNGTFEQMIYLDLKWWC